MPEISVIIPTYNSASSILRSVESVVNQTYQDLELIVVDDGSTDNTRQIMEPLKDDIVYIFQQNHERSAARNTGLRHAKGEFIAFLDADDTWLPTKLDKQMAIFRADSTLDMVYSQSYIVDEDRHIIGMTGSYPVLDADQSFYCRLILGNFIPGNTPLIRRQSCAEAGWFDEDLQQGEDWDYWLRVARRGKVGMIFEAAANFYVNSHEDLLEKMDKRHVHTAYIKILQKVQLAGGCPTMAMQLAVALARLEIAAVDAGLGRNEQARARLQQALEIEPALFTRKSRAALGRLIGLADSISLYEACPHKGIRLLKKIWDLLPEGVSNEVPLREAVGQLYAVRFFRGQQIANWKMARSSLWPMLKNDCTWLRNRGVWSVAVRALLYSPPFLHPLE